MFKNWRHVRPMAAVVLLFALTVTAIGQQSPQLTPTQAPTPAPATSTASTPAPAQTHQMLKVMKSLSRYDEGTKLDIQLTDGSHQIGTVSETQTTYFAFVDSVSGKVRNIDYLDVENVRPTGKGTTARQLHKTLSGHSGFVIGSVVVIGAIALIAIFAFHK